jgi:hypothetical protein
MHHALQLPHIIIIVIEGGVVEFLFPIDVWLQKIE